MRSKPCWTESLMLEIASVYLTVAVVVIVLLLLVTCAEQEAHAELYFDFGAGASFFSRTIEDGTWWQQDLPHSNDFTELAFRAGVGYQFQNGWSLQASYLHLGTAKIATRGVVMDEHYDPKAHQCLSKCSEPERIAFFTKDRYEGAELAVTYTWQRDGLSPFIRGGAALLFHHLQARITDSGYVLDMHGRIPMALLGGGVSYGPFSFDTTWYRGFGGMNCLTPCGLPISQEFLLSIISIKIPLS